LIILKKINKKPIPYFNKIKNCARHVFIMEKFLKKAFIIFAIVILNLVAMAQNGNKVVIT